MKRHIVAVSLEHGKTTCNLPVVVVDPGDTVRWTSEDGDLEVDFKDDTPFTSTKVWRAAGDQMTPVAIVKPGLTSGTRFQPTISINGNVAESQGDVVVR